MKVKVLNSEVELTPSKILGSGGEADVYDIGSKALKIFKTPDHPDFTNNPHEQDAAESRIKLHQDKLRNFPTGLHKNVIAPIDLAYRSSKICGYTMRKLDNAEPLLKYSNKKFRQHIKTDQVLHIFKSLHSILKSIHENKIVIGDFNDLNVLINNKQVYIIDTDSWQFSRYQCVMFTAKFVDPTLCEWNEESSGITLTKPHNYGSDWYAYNVMLMQSLLYVDPYGGVYKPKDAVNKITHARRPLYRVTIFDPEIKYPKPAVPYDNLNDSMVDHFKRVFENDERKVFPIGLLDKDPFDKTATIKPTQTVEVRGKVTATKVFETRGHILCSDIQHGKLRYLYHENGKFKREKGNSILSGQPDPYITYKICGDKTAFGKHNQLIILHNEKDILLTVDSFGSSGLSAYDTNYKQIHWVQAGRLICDGKLSPDYIGDVLSNQTLVWVNDNIGFGFYRAGQINIGFIFKAGKRGINDDIEFPIDPGIFVDSSCYISNKYIWFFATIKRGSLLINQCIIITTSGQLVTVDRADNNSATWLGTIKGKVAFGDFILTPTDEGVVKSIISENKIEVSQQYPDTEPFVDSDSQLFLGKEGLYCVSNHKIQLLKIQ